MNWASSSGEFAWSLWDARDGPENQFGMQNWMAQGGQPLWQVIWFAAKDEINDLPPMVALGTLNTAKPRRERRAHLTEIWRQTVQTWKDYISLTFYTNRSTHTNILPSSTGPPQLHSVTCTCWWSLCTYQNSQGKTTRGLTAGCCWGRRKAILDYGTLSVRIARFVMTPSSSPHNEEPPRQILFTFKYSISPQTFETFSYIS